MCVTAVNYNTVIHASMMTLDQTLSSLKEGERIIASQSLHSLVTGSLISTELS